MCQELLHAPGSPSAGSTPDRKDPPSRSRAFPLARTRRCRIEDALEFILPLSASGTAAGKRNRLWVLRSVRPPPGDTSGGQRSEGRVQGDLRCPSRSSSLARWTITETPIPAEPVQPRSRRLPGRSRTLRAAGPLRPPLCPGARNPPPAAEGSAVSCPSALIPTPLFARPRSRGPSQ